MSQQLSVLRHLKSSQHIFFSLDLAKQLRLESLPVPPRDRRIRRAHKSLTRSDPAIYAYLRFGIRRQEAEERVFRREVEAASR